LSPLQEAGVIIEDAPETIALRRSPYMTPPPPGTIGTAAKTIARAITAAARLSPVSSWRMMSHKTHWETRGGKYDEHSSKFSLSIKPKFN
jgi:hypothetical protein